MTKEEKCRFCGGKTKQVTIPKVVQKNGHRKVIFIDAVYCEKDKNFYTTNETYNTLKEDIFND